MNKVYIATLIVLLSVSFVFAEEKIFISNGEYQIITLENFSTDQIPHQIDYLVQPRDIGCMYMDQISGEQFFVLIHNRNIDEFNKGLDFGNINVKFHIKLLTVYRGMKIYEFIKWSN